MLVCYTENFTAYFSKYGEITESFLICNKRPGRSRNYGFVTFSDPAVADKVLEQDHFIDGTKVMPIINYPITIPIVVDLCSPALCIFHSVGNENVFVSGESHLG